jgi:hypothetical protein
MVVRRLGVNGSNQVGDERSKVAFFVPVINIDRRLAHSKERAMRKEKITADRLFVFSDGIFD